MSDQPSLFPRDIGRVGDRLGRVYTPQSLADAIMEEYHARLRAFVTVAPIIIDSALGAARFAKACRKVWPRARIIGVDIDPDCEGKLDVDEFILGDWLEIARSIRIAQLCVDLIATNPPYTRGTGRFNEDKREIMEGVIGLQIDACRAVVGARTCLLLPSATLFAGPEAEARPALDRHPPIRCTRISGRPWKVQTREVSAFEWPATAYDGDTIVPSRALASSTGEWI